MGKPITQSLFPLLYYNYNGRDIMFNMVFTISITKINSIIDISDTLQFGKFISNIMTWCSFITKYILNSH